MKRIKYYLASLVASVLLLSSCSESFFDINVNPNNPAQATPELVLPSGVAGTAYVLGGYYHALGSYWTQHYAQSPSASQWSEWESYNLTEDDFNRQFNTLYAGALYDYDYVRNNSAAAENWSYYTIATLMQAYTYQVVADLHDKVPFTEALKGVANLQPRFDDGQLIYDSLLARIDNAISKDFTLRTVEDPGTSDVVFGGSMEQWVQFANTLKLKMYLRYVKVNPEKFRPQIVALLNENNFLTQDAKYSGFKDQEISANPFYNTFVDRLASNVIANTTLMTFLNDSTDPRREKLFNASEVGNTYNSVVTGASIGTTGVTIRNYATPIITATSPVYFFSKEEVLFLIAEAQARYGTAAAAEAAYNAGIKASLVSLGLAENAQVYPYNGIKSIIEQKWVAATNKNGIEAFFDYNRTGYPDFLSRSLTSVFSGNERPRRLFYPGSERKTNANTPDRVALTTPVWWALGTNN